MGAIAVPEIEASIDFIADKFNDEKPFYFHPASGAAINTEEIQLSNIIWDARSVRLHSMRDANLSLEKNGFCYVQHKSNYLPYDGAPTEITTDYQMETERMMQSYFDAEFVTCYDYRRRKNSPVTVEAYDPDDPQHVDQVAKGAHVDITIGTIADFVTRLLTPEQQIQYLSPEYRIRVVNTWRSILPICEDRPLAVCDYHSIDPHDLIPTDRVYPEWLQEIYHLRYNPKQRWYWLPDQRADEPLVFISYDSQSGSNARYCAHISFDNSLAAPDAPPRQSVETRTLVVTRK
ncbi:hypothetical protein AC579_3494 [Pseudocercospora musae]|uniref:Methyltransferase n=1 Tax=Pseudocercospora musae TaxID=113226 RepID=A0A139GTF5_9PEZI|nr:hypothetical protein AC579_3494 [Pseudocercospora musae]